MGNIRINLHIIPMIQDGVGYASPGPALLVDETVDEAMF